MVQIVWSSLKLCSDIVHLMPTHASLYHELCERFCGRNFMCRKFIGRMLTKWNIEEGYQFRFLVEKSKLKSFDKNSNQWFLKRWCCIVWRIQSCTAEDDSCKSSFLITFTMTPVISSCGLPCFLLYSVYTFNWFLLFNMTLLIKC